MRPTASSSGRRAALLAVALAVVAAAAVGALAVTLQPSGRRPARVEVGSRAPALAGRPVRGGAFDLGRLRGHVVLVSFVDTRAEATAAGDPSRAQLVFLRSMHTQHRDLGVRMVVVDASEVAGDGQPSRSELVNFTYDWSLDPAIPVLADDGANASRFAVRRAPTTFLIDDAGIVRARWDGFAPAARLDLAIRALEGRSPTD